MQQTRVDPQDDLLAAVVVAAKDHLGADISFLAEVQGDIQIIRRRAYRGASCPMEEGAISEFQTTYCHRLLHDQIPHVVNDARRHPAVCDLPVTRELNIGSYIGMPIRLPDGSLYGTLCCVSHGPTRLGEQDVRFLSVLVDIVSAYLWRHEEVAKDYLVRRQRIQQVLELDPPRMVYQPIVNLVNGAVVGVESLAHFQTEPVRSPDRWFTEAWDVGLGVELELLALKQAMANLQQVPVDAYLSVNLSAQTLVSSSFFSTVGTLDLSRVVIELTEHTGVADYGPLCAAIARLRELGAQLAVDDVGAGYSGLSHILQLQPHILKLDRQLIADIHEDVAKQAMVSGVISFAMRTGVAVVAEGVECQQEVAVLKDLGVVYGQGYYFARPAVLSPLPEIRSLPSHPLCFG